MRFLSYKDPVFICPRHLRYDVGLEAVERVDLGVEHSAHGGQLGGLDAGHGAQHGLGQPELGTGEPAHQAELGAQESLLQVDDGSGDAGGGTDESLL